MRKGSALALFCIALGTALACDTACATELGASGSRFTIDGKPAFLFGISYYGGLGASKETLRQDLAEIRQRGFNWLRVWVTWAAFGNDVSAFTADGQIRGTYLERLRALIADCDRRGLVVDVTISRGDGAGGPPRLGDLESHRRVVERLTRELLHHRNWYLDLANERNIQDKRFTSFDDLAELLSDVKRIDAKRLVTASHGGDIGREDLRRYLLDAKVDFLCPHRPRDPDSPEQTEPKTKEYLGWMKELGRLVPIHYQEPLRRGYGKWQPRVEDFLNDLRGAKDGGAAGWCFHNGGQRDMPGGEPRRSFDLSKRRLFEQLDEEERKLLAALPDGNTKLHDSRRM